MTKIDWSRAKPRRDSESVHGQDLSPRGPPRIKRISKAQRREMADAAVRDWRSRKQRG
jgi:hypothetical protein